MLEPIMYASIGFLVATLLMVAFIPLIMTRAVRLTVRSSRPRHHCRRRSATSDLCAPSLSPDSRGLTMIVAAWSLPP